MKIIARKKEQSKLEELFASDQSELIAVYGRRRVGKTYLVRNFFYEKQCVYFELIGQKLENGDAAPLRTQLAHFQYEYKKAFSEKIQVPRNWEEAFRILKEKIDSLRDTGKKIVIFFDELPWLCSPKSRFIANFDQAWNASFEPATNVKVIVCGSASTWMLKKIIYARAGLSRRVTYRMHLSPFTLAETAEYLRFKKFSLSNEFISEVYMIFGGVPFYLNFLSPQKSIYQNIEDECFRKNGNLVDEFEIVFNSLFKNADDYRRLMQILNSKHAGMTRNEIKKAFFKTRSDQSNVLYKMLDNLEECDFVRKRIPLFNASKGALYSVADEFSMFYLKWIQPVRSRISNTGSHFQKIYTSHSYKVWLGFMFEMLCLKHEENIRRALGLDKIPADTGVFYAYDKTSGKRIAQIDMVFDRADKTIMICEIKYYNSEFELTKADLESIRIKKNALLEHVSTKQISRGNFLVAYITQYGVKRNAVYNELNPFVVSLDDLFVC